MLFAFVAGALGAQVYTQGGGGVSVETRYVWPQKVDRGYVPVQIRIDNASVEDREIRLELLESYGYSAKTERTVRVEGGGRQTVEILLPAYMEHPAQHHLSVYDGVEWLTSINSIGPYERSTDARGSMLYASATEPDFDDTYAWVDRLLLSDQNAVGAAAFADLPDAHGAYSSLSLVVLDVSGGLPEREKLEPIASWVRLGGSLVLVGDEARHLARTDELLGPWMEERFTWTPWIDGGLLPGLNGQAMGMGHLGFLTEEELGQPLIVQSVASPAWSSPLAQRLPRGSSGKDVGAVPAIPGVEHLPRGAFAFLMFGVAVLLGPVNAFIVKLLKRPASLLATTPVLALSSTALMVGYGLAHNGLGVRTANHSVTLLDQRDHTAATHVVRQLYVGFSPRGGMRPSPDTLHFPVSMDWDFAPEMGWDEGRVLGGDLVPVRTATRQVVITEGSARQRLEVSGDQVSNSLGADVEVLLVRTGDGFLVLEDLDEGDTASLRAVEDLDAELALLWRSDMRTRTMHAWQPRAMDWPEGSYVARIDESPFVDDEGVDPDEAVGEHWVIGVLEGA